MTRVIIESPYSGKGDKEIEKRNVEYARMCLLDSLKRGEAPIASNLLHAQVLDDDDPEQRKMGIAAGLAWTGVSEKSVFYVDYGWSDGMLGAQAVAENQRKRIELRKIL